MTMFKGGRGHGWPSASEYLAARPSAMTRISQLGGNKKAPSCDEASEVCLVGHDLYVEGTVCFAQSPTGLRFSFRKTSSLPLGASRANQINVQRELAFSQELLPL